MAASAHAAGIVHRDFKPENVVLGADGRARVLDFGLALRASLRRDPSPGPTALSQSSRGDRAEDCEHDTAGRSYDISGTPLYMAPEQHRGELVDDLCDQYSFCASLYRALYDLRPFEGATLSELAHAKQTCDLTLPTRARRVPRGLRNMVLRGLQPQASRRHTSMAAIVCGLQAHDPSGRRRRWAPLAAIALAIGALWVVIAEDIETRVACSDGSSRAAEFWNDEVRNDLQRRSAADRLEGSKAVVRRLVAGLDARVAAWKEQMRDACEATRVAGTQPASVLALRKACLATKLDEIHQLARQFEDIDQRALAGALPALKSLSDLDECRDPEGWSSRYDDSAAPVAMNPSHSIGHEGAVSRHWRK